MSVLLQSGTDIRLYWIPKTSQWDYFGIVLALYVSNFNLASQNWIPNLHALRGREGLPACRGHSLRTSMAHNFNDQERQKFFMRVLLNGSKTVVFRD